MTVGKSTSEDKAFLLELLLTIILPTTRQNCLLLNMDMCNRKQDPKSCTGQLIFAIPNISSVILIFKNSYVTMV